jgi:hypothetical protein
VAQASTTTTSVQQIIKNLNDLTAKAIARVYRDSRAGNIFRSRRPDSSARSPKSSQRNRTDFICSMERIAHYLGETGNWNEKLLSLLALMRRAASPKDPAVRLLMGAINTLVAEVLNGAAALHELIGETENLGAALLVLVDLFLGQSPDDSCRSRKA